VDPQQVFELFEALQNDIEGCDNMVIETVRNMETVEHVNEQTLNADDSDEQQTELQQVQQSVSLSDTSNLQQVQQSVSLSDTSNLQQVQQSVSLSVSDTSSTLPQKRFKQLNIEPLLE
jgi:hypothetical protein